MKPAPEHTLDVKAFTRCLLRILEYLWTWSKLDLAGMLLLRAVQSILPVLQLYVTARLVNQAASLFTGELQQASPIVHALLLQLLLFLLQAGAHAAHSYQFSRISQLAKLHIDRLMMEKSSNLSLMKYESSRIYDDLQRSQGHGERAVRLVDSLFDIGKNVITLISFVAILFAVHWGLGLGMLLVLYPFTKINAALSRMRFQLMLHQTPDARKLDHLLNLLISRQAAKEIRVFQLQAYLLDKWSRLFGSNARERLRLERKNANWNFLLEGSGSVIVLGISALLIWFGYLGRLSIGHYVALTQSVLQTQKMIEDISFRLANVHEDVLFASTLLSFLDEPDERMEQSAAMPPSAFRHGKITVSGLTLHYPTKQAPALQQVSFHIRPGEKIAIVGANGSGKTSLVKCLLGLYSEYEGVITYDGIDIRQISRTDLRKHVTAVFQDFVQYPFTAKENIAIGQIDKLPDMNAIRASAAKSGADEFIHSLRNGYDTEIGPFYLGGQDLSYGQWQKIAISRAFIRNADVIVLDEPTASIDPLAEVAVYERFLELAEGKTAIFISHRLGSCRYADRILVMKEGQLVECGSHEELLSLNGEYAHMFRMQAKWYTSIDRTPANAVSI